MTSTQMNSPVAAPMNKAQVGEFARNLAESLGYKPNDDIEKIVYGLGGRIEYQDILTLQDEESGSIIIEALDKFRIILASHTSKERDRFTIAHELGHYFLHCVLPAIESDDISKFVPMRATRYGSDNAEWQANWFAASFLMPADKFRQVFAETKGDVYALAQHFGVSVSAASVRVKSLGLDQ
ncbi:MAG: ImmA/IrrE family metallo-endopeptidase [Achromobacter sp.]|uniref:ImmA/IrrE family metallo-endopeptidase n=1 Tax=Achromobacter sp. TaxID=134375 RepID=UPI003D08C517